MGGQPLVQRLRDRQHSWDLNGLASLIPNGLAQGLAGYAYICPDMIGGGKSETLRTIHRSASIESCSSGMRNALRCFR